MGSHPNATLFFDLRTEWDSNPRGLAPTRFPIVRLKPLGHPSRHRRAAARPQNLIASQLTEGVGWTSLRSARTHAASSFGVRRGFSSHHHPVLLSTEGVGFEPTRAFWAQRLSRAPP